MKKIFVLLFGIFMLSNLVAQEKPDPIVFKKPVEVTPNPPKAVKGWTYIENWTDNAAKSEKEQPISVLVGEYPGQVINFPFSGKAIGIAVYSGADAGMIEFSVDEADWQMLDLFSVASQSEYSIKYYTLESDLKREKHMLQMRVSADKNPNSKGQKCILRYFIVNAN